MSLGGFISDRGPFLRRTIPQLSQLGNGPALRSAFSRGGTCQYLGGFHQLGRCAREGREGGTRSGFIDLALCFAFPVAVSLEGQMTLSRGLPLMKTIRFLAGLPEICAHPGSGRARDKSPDPRLRDYACFARYIWLAQHLGLGVVAVVLFGEAEAC